MQWLKDEMENNILLGDYEKEKIQERLAKFHGGLAIIKAGGSTDLIMNETRDRIEDAVFAVRAALDEGIVIGGGSALLQASKCLDSLSHLTTSED
jgi:chaperonin GroEL (HSP60 family)